jgi:F5/8 type C domain-containing protein
MTLEPSAPTATRLSTALREFLLLEGSLRSVPNWSSDQRARIRRLVDAADARLSVADSLCVDRDIPAALVLLRDAAVLTIAAILEARGPRREELTANGAFEILAPLLERGELPRPPIGFDRIRQLFSDTRPLVLDELPPTIAIARRTEALATVAWLRKLVDVRTVHQLRVIRSVRVAVIGLAILGAVAWSAIHLFGPKNLALHKAVQLSSRRPDCPAGAGPEGAPPSGLVDGSKSASFDICTKPETRPWLSIDLLAVHRLSKVVVYNRGDCCWESALPSVLEISEDGATFTEVGRRLIAYSSSDPWVVRLDGQPAKVIRLRVDSNDPYRELVLNEVEVFGR